MAMPKSRQVAIVSDHFIFNDQGIQRGGGCFGAWERVFVIALSVRGALLDI